MDMRKAEKSMTSPWITLAILSGLGIIAMSAETMVLPAIPDFIVDLDISYEVSSWILAAPLVTGAVMTPIAGKLSDIYGKKKVLLIILAVYILGLLLGAMATNFFSLVTARVMNGIGISMFPIAFSIIRDKFPPERLAIAQGIFSSTLSGGAVIGLIIGGAIVENFGWRAIFLFLMPIAIILFAIIAKFVHVKELGQQQMVSNKATEFCCRFTHVRQDILLTENTNSFTSSSISKDNLRSEQKINKSIDIKGAITLSITVTSFLITLQFLEKVGSHNIAQIIFFSVASVVSLFLFIGIEKKAPFPLIDFKLLKNKVILSANIINMTVGLTALMVIYQSLPILIESTTCGVWRKRNKYSKCSTALYDSFIDIFRSFWFSGIQIWKSKTHHNRNHHYFNRLFCPLHVSFNRSFNSCDSCLGSYWISLDADWFSECRAYFYS